MCGLKAARSGTEGIGERSETAAGDCALASCEAPTSRVMEWMIGSNKSVGLFMHHKYVAPTGDPRSHESLIDTIVTIRIWVISLQPHPVPLALIGID